MMQVLPNRIQLQLEEARFTGGLPNSIVAVYLNLPANSPIPGPGSPSFAGYFTFFGDHNTHRSSLFVRAKRIFSDSSPQRNAGSEHGPTSRAARICTRDLGVPNAARAEKRPVRRPSSFEVPVQRAMSPYSLDLVKFFAAARMERRDVG